MQKPPKPGFLDIDTPIHTIGIAPDHMIPAPRTSDTLNVGPHGHGIPVYYQNHNTIKATTKALEQEYQIKSIQLPQTIEIELAATRLEGSTDPLPPVQSIIRELDVRNKLTLRKAAEFHSKTAIAHSFYGGDPFNRHINEFMKKATTIEKRPVPNGVAMQALFQSMRAAHDARLLSQGLEMLSQQHVNVQNFLTTVQANEQAQTFAAELARVNEEAAARAREQTRLAALENARRVAAEQAQEQARLAALENARQVAEEQARIAAQAAARQVAAEQALLEAQVEVKRQEEKAREAKEREEAIAKKQVENLARLNETAAMYKAWEASRASRPFPVLGWSAAAGPVFTLENGRLAAGAATTQAVRTALQTSVTTVVTASTAAASAVMVGFAALLFPSPLDNGERRQLSARLSSLVPDNVHTWDLSITEYEPDNLHALSIPLSDLTTDIDDLHAVAQANGKVRLPIAIGSRKEGNSTEYFVVTTIGTSVPGDVPVRLATFDSDLNVYRSYNPDAPSIGIAWTPIVKPGDASTTLPASEPNIAVYDGTALTALEGRLDEFPELDLYSFGGFITVFPTESGLPPIFTMFRDRRDEPGVASGYGDPVSGIWLEPASKGIGAVIPNQIAGKLREQNFSNFRSFRETFWRSIVEDPTLAKQFTTQNIQQMKKGRAPFSHKKDWVGGKIKFELHHLHSVSDGGDVYDFDNIRVVTPKLHTELHKGGN
ncbi:S-type pyocin domain-containing protein [Pseudomonas sp. CLCA07]